MQGRAARQAAGAAGRRAAQAGVDILAQHQAGVVAVDQFAQARDQAGQQRVVPAGLPVDRGRQARQRGAQLHRLLARGVGTVVHPGRDVGQHPGRRRRQRAALRLQGLQAVFDGRDRRRQRGDVLLHGTQGVGGPADVAGVERHVGRQQAQLGDVVGQRAAVPGVLRGAALVEYILDPAARVAHGGVQAAHHGAADAARQHHAVDQRGADDAQADFLDARQRGVEHQRRVGHAGKADHGGGIAGQHEEIRARRAVEHGDVQAQADPQHHGQRHQHGVVGQARHGIDRHGRAEESAAQAVHRLGAHGAGPRLRNDIGRGHGPERTRQPDGVRQVERQHGAQVALDREHRLIGGRQLHGR